MMKFIHIFFCVIVILAFLMNSSGFADITGIEKNITIQTFQDNGYLVGEGKMETVDAIALYDAGIIPSCYAINPGAPYMAFKVPKAPGQTTNNTISDAPLNPENKGLWCDFRMRPDEAFVYFGTTPPKCDYFSYCGYIALRYFPEENKGKRIYASLGDTVNLQRLTETVYPEGAFSQPIILIFTADLNADKQIREILNKAGYPDEMIFTQVIPESMVRMGLEIEDDTFTTLHRVAYFNDQEEGAAYMNSTPGYVLRLTPEKQSEPQFFNVPDFIVRGTGDNREFDLLDDLEELHQAIIEKYGKDKTEDLNTKVWIFEGYDAIQRGIDALGDNRDTIYLNTSTTLLGNESGECIIVYGVNHAATKKATYTNFGLYGMTALNGIQGVSNHEYMGTAEEFLPDNPNAQYLYVAKISREDDGKSSTSVIPSGVGAYGIEPDEPCFVGYRMYVEPETSVGPVWNEIVYDRALKINP